MFHVEEQGWDGTYRPLTAFEIEEEARAFIAKHATYSGNGARLVEVESRERWAVTNVMLSGERIALEVYDSEGEAKYGLRKRKHTLAYPMLRITHRTTTDRTVMETFEPTVA